MIIIYKLIVILILKTNKKIVIQIIERVVEYLPQLLLNNEINLHMLQQTSSNFFQPSGIDGQIYVEDISQLFQLFEGVIEYLLHLLIYFEGVEENNL